MPDTYREPTEQKNESESAETQSETVIEAAPEIAAAAKQEPVAAPEKVEKGGFDVSREGRITDQEMDNLKTLADMAAAKGIDTANETAKEYAEKNNDPHFLDLWHDYLSQKENQSKLGIKQI